MNPGNPSASRRATGWWPAWLCLVLFAACEPRVIEIKGLEELTSEIRSQRLRAAGQAQAGSSNAASSNAEVRGEQILTAMAPLREVLTQLGRSQSELATRQTDLTQEMRRWTQLLVQSSNTQHREEANQLGTRLAELEASMAQQDERHRQVEALLGTALDRTADQLEEFLKRVGAMAPNAGEVAPGGSSVGGEPPTPLPENSGPLHSPAGTATPGNAEPGNATPGNNNGGEEPATDDRARSGQSNVLPGGVTPEHEATSSQRASLSWLWGLAVLSFVSGCMLLLGRHRRRPVAMAHEMQCSPEVELGEPEPARAFAQGLAEEPAAADKPEIDGLWAAAALLGEAIGRLKQTGEQLPPELGGQAALPEAPAHAFAPAEPPFEPLAADEPDAAMDGEFDDLFVIDDDEYDAALFGERSDSMASLPAVGDATIDHLAAALERDLEEPEWQDQPAAELPPRAAATPTPAATATEAATPTQATTPSHAIEPNAWIPRPPAGDPDVSSRQPANRHLSSSPLTCRLQFPANAQAETRLRSMLGADPRVLAAPAPEVRSAMGALEVSFALLPGLPPGERSLLEQQLRDTVA